MLGGRKITATLTGEIMEGSVVKCCMQRGILLPHSCEAWVVDELVERLGNGC